MRVKVEIDLDLETGDYGMKVHNLSEPGKAIDYARVRKILGRVVGDVDQQQAAPAAKSATAPKKAPPKKPKR